LNVVYLTSLLNSVAVGVSFIYIRNYEVAAEVYTAKKL